MRQCRWRISTFRTFNRINIKSSLFLIWPILCTIDINLPELQYLADHLASHECRELVASLHFKSHDKPKSLDEAELQVSKDISCLKLLLHWNSAKDEGKGETHEAVQHRLRQIGRADLADWLGKTVFHELGHDLERSLENPFKTIVNTTQKEHKYSPVPTFAPPSDNEDPTEWVPFDSICWALVVGLSLTTLIVLGKVVCMLCGKRGKRRKRAPVAYYSELESDVRESGSESEDIFDVRDHYYPTLKLTGLTEH